MRTLPTVCPERTDSAAYIRQVFRLEHQKHILEKSRRDGEFAVPKEEHRARRWIPLFNLVLLYGGVRLLNPLSRHLAGEWAIPEEIISRCCITVLFLAALVGSVLLWNLPPRARAERRQNKNGCLNVLSHQIDLTVREIDATLGQLYGYEILPPKYRTFHAVGHILLYLEGGCAKTLTEALNQYDHDILHGSACTQADEISFSAPLTQSIVRENAALIQNTFDGIGQPSASGTDMVRYRQLAAENFKVLRDSVKSTEFLQTVEMLDRTAKK